jgi:hypothetical protein
VEHYWGALLRDAFENYSSSSLAAQACADLNSMSFQSRNNVEFPYPVTP